MGAKPWAQSRLPINIQLPERAANHFRFMPNGRSPGASSRLYRRLPEPG